MAEAITQATKPIRFKTPLGPDRLLIDAFEGSEAISELFSFTLDLSGEVKAPAFAFEAIIGKPATIIVDQPASEGGTRYIHGILSWFSQKGRGREFISYQAELVPTAWILTRMVRNRIFQQKSVTDILKIVFAGLEFEIRAQGAFEPRDYCVQYRESDWDFASRLMEEEGIYYFFLQGEGSAKLILANTPQGHPKVPAPDEIKYDPSGLGNSDQGRIETWEKVQAVVTGQVTLWDHCFELPGKNFEHTSKIEKTLAIGSVTHKLTAGDADKLELYDYPGDYAGRFDGIAPGGGEQASEVSKIFDDSKRTADIRMQETAALAMRIYGTGNCMQLTSGHTFKLAEHFDADGEYVVTRVEHSGNNPGFRSGDEEDSGYSNSFECIPKLLPFRPERVTAKPTVQGAQTATVVGPAGSEIFTDKYGRVKVQFHWDREGKKDSLSSCWIRVGTPWAGAQWGMIHIPRIGQEVVVDYLEGDPDQPIIVGSVYNAEQMPPWKLPDNMTQSGILTRSTKGGGAANANAMRFEDKKGSEQIWIHAEKNQDIEVENDETHTVGHDRTKMIGHDEITHVKHDRTETVDNNETITIHGNRVETVDKNETITIKQNRTETVIQNETVTVSGARAHTIAKTDTLVIGQAHTITVGGAQAITVASAQAITVGAAQAITVGGAQAMTIGDGQTITVGSNLTENVGGGMSQSVGKDAVVKVGGGRSTDIAKDESLKVGKKLAIEAADEIVIKTGDASITMKKDGTIAIKGKDILIEGSGKITGKASGDMVMKGSKIGLN